MHRLRLITMHDPMNAFPTIQIPGICEKRDENGEHVEVVEIVPDALDCGERLLAQPHKSTDEIAAEAGCRCRSVNGSLVSRVWFSTCSDLYLVASVRVKIT